MTLAAAFDIDVINLVKRQHNFYVLIPKKKQFVSVKNIFSHIFST